MSVAVFTGPWHHHFMAEEVFLKTGIDLVATLGREFAKLRAQHHAELPQIGKLFRPTDGLAIFYVDPVVSR